MAHRKTKVEKDRENWVLTSDNTDDELAAWDRLYDDEFGPRKHPDHLQERPGE